MKECDGALVPSALVNSIFLTIALGTSALTH